MEPKLSKTYTAFCDNDRLITGALPDVARKLRRVSQRNTQSRILIFDDQTGEELDLNLQGSEEEVVARLQAPVSSPANGQSSANENNTPGVRGRPKLGVVAREVTLLPRHWEWLNVQPGGASVALRKLVEEARRLNTDADRHRLAREAAYRFLSAMGGNLPRFEEAARALFRGEHATFVAQLKGWPADIRKHAIALAGRAGDKPAAPSPKQRK